MMEPLSGAASAIAVVSLAIQISASISKLRKFHSSVADASQDVQRLSDELLVFEDILDETVKRVTRCSGQIDPRIDQSHRLYRPLKICEGIKNKLNEVVAGLEARYKKRGPKDFLASIRAAFKKDQLREFEQQLLLALHLLQASQGDNWGLAESVTVIEKLDRIDAHLSLRTSVCDTNSQVSKPKLICLDGPVGRPYDMGAIQTGSLSPRHMFNMLPASETTPLPWRPIVDKIQPADLHEAAIRGDTHAVRLLFKAGLDTAAKDACGETALHKAAENGHQEVVRLLLERGADIAVKNKSGRTALHWAARRGHRAVVQLLLDEGAKVDAAGRFGGTALHWAAENGHEAVVRLLLEKGANVAARNNFGRTALHWAAGKGHEAVIQLLLEKGAEVEAKELGETALHRAAENGHNAVIRLLLERGADANAKDESGRTALHLAAKNGHETTIRLLLKNRAAIVVRDKSDQTALHLAAANGHIEVARLLLEQGDDIDTVDRLGRTAEHWAAANGHEAVVELIAMRQCTSEPFG